ncbi:Uncharacterised protein [Mycobacteroides abscessus]|nr:Uncharacterised protein [Mycobacteroides abscessus]
MLNASDCASPPSVEVYTATRPPSRPGNSPDVFAPSTTTLPDSAWPSSSCSSAVGSVSQCTRSVLTACAHVPSCWWNRCHSPSNHTSPFGSARRPSGGL